ncbi:MAG: DUF3108 domain-containing protein [Bacteroidota bacterium]|nr:DUF3108 domain-containing protein [Bacteroidota bacterium]MDP4249990.1 DUF3108 domain-containing protein [Bacteroidota bacterium]
MKSITGIGLLMMMAVSLPLRAGDDFCGVKNTAFQANESITYRVYYTLAGVYIAAGEATFSNVLETLNGKPVYHVTGEGHTYNFYDNFFKVRDKYESFIDTATLQPYKFIRNVNEGTYRKYENNSFNKTANTVITSAGVFKTPACIQDVLSSLYYARNIDFSKMQPGDKIPFSMFLDNQIYNLYIRYLGKEIIKTKYGKFRAIKFKPLLIKGTIFEGGEKMTVWVSDDPNHIPVRVESPISVGTVKVDMMDFRNRRSPLSSLISVR